MFNYLKHMQIKHLDKYGEQMMKFIKHTHIISSLLFMLAALCISGCDNGSTETCCEYFADSNTFISAVGDPEQGPRDLLTMYGQWVREFAPKTDKRNDDYFSAGQYLCPIMPEMKNINYDYARNNEKDAQNVCADSIPKHAEMANKIKEAWDNCCFVLGNRAIERKENECRQLESNGNSESSSKCKKELDDKVDEYLSCFRTYVTEDRCVYMID